jgi:hypothetical protein
MVVASQKTRAVLVSAIVLVLILLAGCYPNTEPAPALNSPLATGTAALSTPSESGIAPTSPQATATVEALALPSPASTNQPGTSTVRGVLHRLNGSAIKLQRVWAAPIDRQAGFPMASMDALNDAHTDTDEAGSFAFSNLKPGEYAFIILSPNGPVMIRTQDSKPLTCDCRGDQMTDFGVKTVDYSYPDGSE